MFGAFRPKNLSNSKYWPSAAGHAPAKAGPWVLRRINTHLKRLPSLFWTLIAIGSLWLALNPYGGIISDARLYSLQALFHLYPKSLGQDIFVLHSSQDRFTLYSHLLSPLGNWLGIEQAALWLTFAGLTGFLAACWLFARQFLNHGIALVGVGLITVLPSQYGADAAFSYLEPFVTPRPLAQAITLVALTALCHRQNLLGLMLLLAATLIHPLMAVAGWIFAGCWIAGYKLALPHPWTQSDRVQAAVLLAAPCAAAGLLAMLLPQKLVFDDEWLQLINSRAPYLFLAYWQQADWAGVAVPLTTLALVVLTGDLRSSYVRIAAAALTTGLCGLAVTGIGADVLKLILVTQGQAWRWMWLSTVVALIMLPALISQLRHRGDAGRVATLLLVAAWLGRHEALSLAISAMALITGCAYKCITPSPQTWGKLLAGAIILLSLTVVYLIALPRFTPANTPDPLHEQDWLTLLRNVCANRMLPIIVVLGLAYGASCIVRPAWRWAIGGASLLGCAVIIQHTLSDWQRMQYPPALVNQLAAWRQYIPESDEVLWYERPEITWLLLRRANYLSNTQTAAALFSRESAMELKRRSIELVIVRPGARPFNWIDQPHSKFTTRSLRAICASIRTNYLVTSESLDEPPVAVLHGRDIGLYVGTRLYRCGRPLSSQS